MGKKRFHSVASGVTKLLSICIVVVLLVNLVVPDKSASDTENRSLQTFPDLSVSSQFEKDLDSWFSDQFVFRNAFIHGKYLVQKVTGVKEINDVYLGKKMLIEAAKEPNQEQLDRNLNAINQFANDTDLNVGFMLVPNAVSVQTNKLPSFADPIDQDKQMDEIFNSLNEYVTKIDARKTLKKHADEYLYYKTDHHWTSLACYYAYQTLAKKFDLETTKKSDYTVYPVTNSFEGTLASATGSFGLKDEIDIYVPKTEQEYLVTNETTNKKSATVYQSKALDTKDKYTVFMGGNSGLIRIEMNNDQEGHLLLIKDSYANSMIPFLLSQYRSITIIDPRYYFEDYNRVIQDDLITDILFMYNTNTFVQDTSLADMLESTNE